MFSIKMIFIVCSTLFLLHQVLQKIMNIHFAPVDNYLDPFLTMPIVLTLLQREKIWFHKQKKDHRISLTEVVLATIYVAFVSEVLFPKLSKNFIGDWWDALFFALGSLLFFIVNKNNVKAVN